MGTNSHRLKKSIAKQRYTPSDPSRWLEYNSISRNINVCKQFWKADIAYSPYYVKSFDYSTDILARARRANLRSVYVSHMHDKAHGRTR